MPKTIGGPSWPERLAQAKAKSDTLAADLARERERTTALTEALTEIADHPVISEVEFPDDNCDWQCTAEIVQTAGNALAALAASSSAEPAKDAT